MPLRDIDLSRAVWHKSTRSGGNGGQCIEVAMALPGIVAIRDSKDTNGPVLLFTRDEWRVFLRHVKAQVFEVRS